MNFVSDLRKLGLSDKEAAVYLAVLGQGPSTVLQIARKSKVARATTYLMLDSLMEQGLVARYEEKGKTFFLAEQPKQLSLLLDKREEELKDKRTSLDELLPQLQILLKTDGSEPTARYYTGIEGMKAIRSEMTMYSKPGDVWYQVVPVDHMRNVWPKDDDLSYQKTRKAKRIESRAIISTSSKSTRAMLEETAEKRWAERKFIDPKLYQSSSGFSVYRDRLVINDFGKTIGGVIIESEQMAKMLKEMFLLLWKFIK